MEKKRILVAGSVYPPAHGGSGLQVHRLYKRLSTRLPIEVTALAESGRGQPPGNSWYEGIQVIRVDRTLSWPTQFLTVTRFMLKVGIQTTKTGFDLLHASDGPPIVLSACIWARLLNIPTMREMTSVREGPSSTAWKERFFRSTFNYARLIHAVNDSVVDQYIAMGLPRERIWVSNYPVDTSQFRFPTPKQRRSARTALGFADTDVVHFILGRIHSHKNQYLGIQTLALLPDHHKLVLAGPPNEAYVAKLRRVIVESNLEKRVVILPERQQNTVPLFQAADIYLVPSLSEAGPNVMLEALCCGVPVIINETIGVTRYVHDGINGFNVPLKAEQFAQAARRLTGIVHDLDQRRAIAERSAEMLGAPSLDPQYARHIARLLRM
jgi:glycosyltransferase involved in cell wall biosynthesis